MDARRWWFIGVAILIAAAVLLMTDMEPSLFMTVGAIGLLICAIAQIIEVRQIGMTADAVDHLAQTVVLGAIAAGFFFRDTGWVLLACFIIGIVAIFTSFGAQIWEKVGETKHLWRRYKERRRGRK